MSARDEQIITLAGGGGGGGGTVAIDAIAVADPCVGNPVPVAPGAVVEVVADVNGRLITLTGGLTPNGDPDCGNPVSMGGTAVSNADIGLPLVAAGDRVRAAMTLAGQIAAQCMGTIAHDAIDQDSNPVKIGGVAVTDPTVGGAAAVASGDRTNLYADIRGRLLSLVQGTVAQDAPIPSTLNPVLEGGYGADNVPTFVSAVGDLVQDWNDRGGRRMVAFDQQIAGENIPLNYLVTMRAKRMNEQDSWLVTPHNNVTGAVVKASPGRLARLQIINTSATGLFVIVHDNTVAGTLVSTAFIRWRGWVNAAVGGVPGVLDIGLEELDGSYFNIGIAWTTSTAVDSIAGAVAVYGSSAYA